MCRRRDEFQGLNTDILLISFSSAGYAAVWSREVCPQLPLLLDHGHELYRLYGLERAPESAGASGGLLRGLRRALGEGGGPAADEGEMGGDVLVDAGGMVRYAYLSQDAADRPPVDALIAAAAAAGRGEGEQHDG